MKNRKILLIALVSIILFLLVYLPHINYSFPFHIDEWHHITEAIKIGNGSYNLASAGFEAGFHFILYLLSLVFNLVLAYKFFPAIWAVLTGLVLFFVVYKKAEKNFIIALFSLIFFASLKSNVNLEGLWFFIPLTFSLPFIFLYFYFFSEGIEKQNKNYIMISLVIMAILVPVHSISVLFAVPIFIIYGIIHRSYLIKEYKFFLGFLLIPLLGIIFYSFVLKISVLNAVIKLLHELQFKYGWGVLEAKNSFFEVYSPVGYLLALFGIFSLIYQKEYRKYLIYLLWPTLTLIFIMIYKLFGVSYLAPYQRTFYYFAISLPFLSAFGLYYLFKLKNDYIDRSGIIDKHYAKKFISLVLVLIVLFFAFYSYYSIPKDTGLYKLINNEDYQALLFLKEKPGDKVMTTSEISSTLYAISGKEPVGAIYFYGNRTESENFFKTNNCSEKNGILKRNKVSYVLSSNPLNCTYPIVYNQTDLIYNVRAISGLK